MTRRRCLIVSMVLVCSMIVFSGSVWADCQQQDLEGTWPALVCGPEACFGDNCLQRCQVQLDADGVIVSTGATIDTECGSWTITGGQLLMFSGCVIQGTVETSNGTLYVYNGAIRDDKLILGVSQE